MSHGESRREFLKRAAVSPIAVSLVGADLSEGRVPAGTQRDEDSPWYRQTYRWGQTNINEKDPSRYDIKWWREYWRRTQTQGVVINAGGIVAYYPSKLPLHHQAQFLNGRDLYGELTRAAHEDGLVVFARMDSNRAHEPLYKAHADWFAVDAEGQPYRAEELYVTCINGPYYEQYIPDVMREIIAWEEPDGFTDNSWSGLGRDSICYCTNCQRRFRELSGADLPRRADWDDPAYRQWIEWGYRRRLEIWDLNNRTTRAAGGPDCIWAGMISGHVVSSASRFRDMKELCSRAEIVMLDQQTRGGGGFQINGETGKRIHGLLGWDKLSPESMATYGPRKAARPIPEVRMWMVEGFAGTIQPWWHHVGAYQEDRRQFEVVEPVYRWYAANQEYLVNREPVATVGVVWSQRNVDYYGRDDAMVRAWSPYRGMTEALIRARIPFLPLHADHIERDSGQFSVLILPNVAAMSDAQADAVRRFVADGGSLIATAETSLYDEQGEQRPDFALADLFSASYTGKRHGPEQLTQSDHSYLRLVPDVGQEVDGPRSGEERQRSAPRHAVLNGFEKTNILAFGGLLLDVKARADATVPVTLIPDFPVYPPETSWMRTPRTDTPALVIGTRNDARIAYLPADIDRRFDQDNAPDHGGLLANLVRWAAGDAIPLEVQGPGLIDCHLYRQPQRLILHLVNLTSAGTWRSPVHELTPVGPLSVTVKLPEGVRGEQLRLTVSGASVTPARRNGAVRFEIKTISDHEVVVVE
ncbi:MAG: Tat pathway signal protein [Luteitalea sp.]|nr:Tat pathway signal protein [Luteitalea sp.]